MLKREITLIKKDKEEMNFALLASITVNVHYHYNYVKRKHLTTVIFQDQYRYFVN